MNFTHDEGFVDTTSVLGGHTAALEPLTTQWLESSADWPDYATEIVAKYAKAHSFWNHKKKSAACTAHLDALKQILFEHFNSTGWQNKHHDEMLRGKILRKLARLRELHGVNLSEEKRLARFKQALENLKDLRRAVEVIVAHVGADPLREELDRYQRDRRQDPQP